MVSWDSVSERFYTVSQCPICIVQVIISWLQRDVKPHFIHNMSSSGPRGIPSPFSGFTMYFPCSFLPPQLWPIKNSSENGHQHLQITVIRDIGSSSIPSGCRHYCLPHKIWQALSVVHQPKQPKSSESMALFGWQEADLLNLKGSLCGPEDTVISIY